MSSASLYIGTALKRPLEITKGEPTIVGDVELIGQSIMDILSTPTGTRFFLREYGSRIDELMFEPNDSVLKTLLRHFIKEAINLWEKRVRFEDIDFQFEEATIKCSILVSIVATNRLETFVYPFYRELKH